MTDGRTGNSRFIGPSVGRGPVTPTLCPTSKLSRKTVFSENMRIFLIFPHWLPGH